MPHAGRAATDASPWSARRFGCGHRRGMRARTTPASSGSPIEHRARAAGDSRTCAHGDGSLAAAVAPAPALSRGRHPLHTEHRDRRSSTPISRVNTTRRPGSINPRSCTTPAPRGALRRRHEGPPSAVHAFAGRRRGERDRDYDDAQPAPATTRRGNRGLFRRVVRDHLARLALFLVWVFTVRVADGFRLPLRSPPRDAAAVRARQARHHRRTHVRLVRRDLRAPRRPRLLRRRVPQAASGPREGHRRRASADRATPAVPLRDPAASASSDGVAAPSSASAAYSLSRSPNRIDKTSKKPSAASWIRCANASRSVVDSVCHVRAAYGWGGRRRLRNGRYFRFLSALSFMISRTAWCPGMPVTPPPACVALLA